MQLFSDTHELVDLRRCSGGEIRDDEVSVQEYVSIHPNIDVMVGTDSQTEGGKTKFSTVVAMYDHGDGVQGHGAHCVYRRWSVPKYRKEQRFDRLMKETEESINTAKKLREAGIKIKFVDIDINPQKGTGSNPAFDASKGWVEAEGFECRWKTLGPLIITFADWIVKK